MFSYLGIDTSNYTTSLALYDMVNNKIIHRKKLLDVNSGAVGLRQSDAVFAHVKAVDGLVSDLFSELRDNNIPYQIKAIGVSARPRDIEGSYMPCFLVGVMVAKSLATVLDCPIYEFSHQSGHIAAAAYSCNRLSLLENEHIAFHLSGGTTECLLVKPDVNNIIIADIISATTDITAGQLIDRVGVMMGLPFPAGAHLEPYGENLSHKIKVAFKELSPCLSGMENKCRDLWNKGSSNKEMAEFLFSVVLSTIHKMSSDIAKLYPTLPIVYAGGVMSHKGIKTHLEKEFKGIFAQPEFSSDNGAGAAILAAIKNSR